MDLRLVIQRCVRLASIGSLTCLALLGCERRAHAPLRANDPAPPFRYEAHVSAGGVNPPAAIPRGTRESDLRSTRSGAQLFEAMNCDGCHGPEGSGSAAPSLQDGRWRYGGAFEEIFYSIYYGRPKGMPAFGGVLGTEGTRAVVTYLMSLPVTQDIRTESWEKS